MTNKIKSKWISMTWFVDDFRIDEIATAIETHGIYCIDGFGRRVKAPEKSKDENDFRSCEYALQRLEGIYYDQNNPEPYDPRDDEFDRSDEDPIRLLGWPEDDCPLLNQNKHEIVETPQYDLNKSWNELAVEIAEAAYQANKAKGGVNGKLDDYCDIVHKEFLKHGIKATHRRVPNLGYIKRNALQGNRWWSGRKK